MTQANFSDKDILKDLLGTQKFTTANYNTALLESATPEVKSCFHNILEDEHELQQNIFNIMHTKGLYPTPSAEEKKISEAKHTYGQTANA